MIANPHPALRGQVAIFGSPDGYGTFYPGGTYREALIDGWLKDTVPTQWQALDALVRTKEQPDTDWWRPVNGTLGYPNVNWPTIHWAGWYDIFQQGNLEAWNGFQYASNPAVRGLAKLVVDPCGHCQGAASLFPHDTAFGRVLLPILMAFDMMSNDNPTNKSWPPVPEGVNNVTFYVMGADETPVAPGNYWTSIPEAPVPTPTNWYLSAGGVLSPTTPTGGAAGSSFFTYDPRNPVPTIGGANLLIPCGEWHLHSAALRRRRAVCAVHARPSTLIVRGLMRPLPALSARPPVQARWTRPPLRSRSARTCSSSRRRR